MNRIRLTIGLCAAPLILALGAGAPTASAAPGSEPVHHNPPAQRHEGAGAATVHPPTAVAANRNQLQTLFRNDMLGMNNPAIAAGEADYAEFWAHDVAAMVGYHGGANALSHHNRLDHTPR